MRRFLGIDTSNYTTSFALCTDSGSIISNEKLLLNVKEGQRGLRQSDAVFSHTVNLPVVAKRLGKVDNIAAIGYSAYPRDCEGSYMPCFLCGKAFAEGLASLLGVAAYPFSHQRGHIRAALYSSGAEHLLNQEYLAFHLSGGTTEILHVKNSEISLIGGSRDLTAGQAIDRVGVMLGLKFPCGAELENLSQSAEYTNKCKISVDGFECNFSGLENMAQNMINKGEDKSIVAAFVLEFVKSTLDKMTENLKNVYPDLPLVYSGGVMSNKKIRNYFTQKYSAYFAAPEFSSDNAAGIALLTFDKERLK